MGIDRSVRPPRASSVRIGTLGPLHGGLAVDSAGQVVYVVNAAERAVYAVDERTNSIVAKGAVGADPDAVVVDPGTHRVYVANRGDGTVTVLQGIARAVAPALPGLPGAGGGGASTERFLPGALLLGLAALATAAPGRPRTGDPSRSCRRSRSPS